MSFFQSRVFSGLVTFWLVFEHTQRFRVLLLCPVIIIIVGSGSVNVGSRAVPSELYSPNSEGTVGYVQAGSPQPSGFAVNVGVCTS